MTHVHKRTGIEYEVGFVSDFDMTIITRWPKDLFEEGQHIEFVNYYFGEYDEESTDHYIDEYLEKQEANNN